MTFYSAKANKKKLIKNCRVETHSDKIFTITFTFLSNLYCDHNQLPPDCVLWSTSEDLATPLPILPELRCVPVSPKQRKLDRLALNLELSSFGKFLSPEYDGVRPFLL